MEEFFSSTKICFGTGALAYLKQITATKVFIVADPFVVESGMIQQVTGYLTEGQYQVFSRVEPDPSLELVVEGIQALKESRADAILAVGGGSSIDEAKAIGYFAKKEGYERKLSFLAVPTTSGTGSEVTSFAVITDPKKGRKYPLVDKSLRPDVAILDADLVKSVPPAITADTGMDVLTHALEAYVSTKATSFTDALAMKAALTVFACLKESYENSENSRARERMHEASCMAGLAFDMASLGLNHAIAHNIGGKFHIPHGRANAILLPHVVEYNAELLDYQQKEFSTAAKKYAQIAQMAGLGGISIRSSVKNLIQEIARLQKQLNMPISFRTCGIPFSSYEKEMEKVAEGAKEDACIITNPREASHEEILQLLKKAW